MVWLLAIACAPWLSACNKQEEIRRYQVPKPDAVFAENNVPRRGPTDAAGQPVALTDLMLAAVVRRGEEGWFFKLAGPKEAVAAEEKAFRQFVESVRFAAGSSDPKWDKPEAWQESSGPAPRFATLKIGGSATGSGAKPLELTVSRLPISGENYLLPNVNRWRGQMSLGPIRESELAKEIEPLTLKHAAGEKLPAHYVRITGKLSTGGMGGPMAGPFAGGLSPTGGSRISPNAANEPPREPAQPQPGAAPAGELKYKTPDGWAPSQRDAFSRVALEVRDGAAAARVTVSSLNAAAGELLPNVKRWRGQVGMPAAADEAIEKEIKPIEIDGQPGHLVELVGPQETILGAIVVAKGQAWFVKLRGPNQLAKREQARFAEFVHSLKF